jgi:predicted nucleic acid-binding protein
LIAGEVGLAADGDEQDRPAGAAVLAQAIADGWLQIRPAGAAEGYQPLNPGVDAGEASAIALALQHQSQTPGLVSLLRPS